MDGAHRLTIVLTLKDRPEFTRRWMSYMNDHKCPYKIIVADGGADKTIEDELRSATAYPDLDYEYVRYPYDSGWEAFYAKKTDACERAKTEYVLLADNDDFYLIDEIPSLIDFLDRNPDYSGCRGAVAQFFVMSEDDRVLNAPTGDSYRAAYHECRSIEGQSVVERVEAYLSELVQYSHQINWYCIYRKDDFVSGMKRLYKRRYPDVVLNEMLLLLSLLREGKIKVLEPLFYLRQVGSSQAEAELVSKNNVLEWFLINGAFYQFDEFMRSEGFVFEEPDRVRVLKALSTYVGMYCNDCEKYRRKTAASVFMESLRSWAKQRRTLSRIIYAVLLPVSHRIRGTRKMHAVRVPAIEPYILRKSADARHPAS